MTTPNLSITEMAASQASPQIIVNEAFRLLDQMPFNVISASTTAAPGSPTDGIAYIVPTGGTGAFSGNDHAFAYYSGGWLFLTPRTGWKAYVVDVAEDYAFNGTTWVPYVEGAPQPFDASAFYPGVPGASAKIVRVPIAQAVTFPANFSGSYGVASVAATGSTAFDVSKNGSSIGTITFAGSATTATFVTSGGTAKTFAAGDVLQITAPGSPDATLADVGFVLAGTR